MYEAMMYSIAMLFMIFYMICLYENMKAKTAKRLYLMGRIDEARALCPEIDKYMKGGSDV